MFKRSSISSLIAGAALAVAMAPASATAISGGFSFSQTPFTGFSMWNGPGYTNLAVQASTANTLDFGNNGAVGGGTFNLTTCSGAGTNVAAAIGGGLCTGTPGSGTVKDLVNIALGAGNATASWLTIGNLILDLSTITQIDRGTPTALAITGTGVLRSAGFSNTSGTWVISANSSSNTFSWSGSAGAVPEPATLGLIGLALAGLGFARRRSA